jgi:NADH dehydrogenase
LPWTVVRPTPFLETWIDLIAAEIRTRRRALVFGPGENPINFVSARDVADVTARAVGDERMPGQIFEITGPEDLTFNQIATRLTAAVGLPGNTRHVPLTAMRAMSLLTRQVAPAFARQAHAAVVMYSTDMSAHHHGGHVGPTTVDQLIQERTNLRASN